MENIVERHINNNRKKLNQKCLIRLFKFEIIRFYADFISKKNVAYKTFITQEMLKKKYLASNLIYLSIYHTKKIIDKHMKDLDPVFKK